MPGFQLKISYMGHLTGFTFAFHGVSCDVWNQIFVDALAAMILLLILKMALVLVVLMTPLMAGGRW